MKNKELKIKRIAVVAELTNGDCHNVLMKTETQNVIISTISLCEGGIKLLEPKLDSVKIETIDKKEKSNL